MKRSVISHALLLVVLASCGKKDEAPKPPTEATKPTEAAKPTEATRPTEAAKPTEAAPASAIAVEPTGNPFSVQIGGNKPRAYAEACLTNIGTPFTVMIPSAKNAKPCDVDGEDDYAVALMFHPCGNGVDVRTCALPAPGTKHKATLEVTGGFTGDVDLSVVRHEKPYLVVRIDRQNGDEGTAGGDLRILVEDKHPLVDANSWK